MPESSPPASSQVDRPEDGDRWFAVRLPDLPAQVTTRVAALVLAVAVLVAVVPGDESVATAIACWRIAVTAGSYRRL